MTYLIGRLALWLLLALLLGSGVGWFTRARARPRPFAAPAALGLGLLALGAAAVALKLVPGRAGLWLDALVLFSVAYVLGCVLGHVARGRARDAAKLGTAPATDSVIDREPRPVPPSAQPMAGTHAPPDTTSSPGPAAMIAAAPAAVAVTAPAPAAAPIDAEEARTLPGLRPEGLATARGGAADDLRRIRGVGPQNEARLHGLGVYHFDQVAGWGAEQVLWVGGYLAFPGRIEREDWVGQAKALAAGEPGAKDVEARARALAGEG